MNLKISNQEVPFIFYFLFLKLCFLYIAILRTISDIHDIHHDKSKQERFIHHTTLIIKQRKYSTHIHSKASITNFRR
jgi:hypothetical protein